MADEFVDRGTLRARRAGGRHHAGAKLSHNLFPSFGASRDLRGIHCSRESRRFQPAVMAALTVLRTNC